MLTMIVDDEALILEEMSDGLSLMGIQSYTANSVNQALEGLQKKPEINWVITDLRMPNKSGEILIRQTNETIKRKIKFIVMSGHGGDKLIEDNLKSSFPNVVGFIRKPVSFEQLQELAKKILNTP